MNERVARGYVHREPGQLKTGGGEVREHGSGAAGASESASIGRAVPLQAQPVSFFAGDEADVSIGEAGWYREAVSSPLARSGVRGFF